MIGRVFMWCYVILPVAIAFCVMVYMEIENRKARKRVYAARDALNERFLATGSPAFYACPYSEWEWVESYDRDPAEAATKYMKETLRKYNRFLERGGNPSSITDIEQMWQKREA